MNQATGKKTLRPQCCVVGGGPAGMMVGYLLARAGIEVVVLEKHKDFLRDFRGDTIHPSTLELMHELGLLEEFLQRPHQRLPQFKLSVAGKTITLADFSKLKTKCKFIAFMPQWDFLNFLVTQAKMYPSFNLLMEAEAVDLIQESGRVVGVSVDTVNGPMDVLADLTISADGRNSSLRGQADLKIMSMGAPIDVLWMRVSKGPHETTDVLGTFGPSSILVTIDRGNYWQCAYIIPKGRFDEFKKRGINYLRDKMVALRPSLRASIGDIGGWDDCNLLTVVVDRLLQWWCPGFLCIGDAAHAMSPVGGIGINLAIQDGVAAANELVPAFQEGDIDQSVLERIQLRRERPTRTTQRFQVFVQERILGKVLSNREEGSIPIPLRLIGAIPLLQRLPARMIGIGIRPEHIRTPDVGISAPV